MKIIDGCMFVLLEAIAAAVRAVAAVVNAPIRK